MNAQAIIDSANAFHGLHSSSRATIEIRHITKSVDGKRGKQDYIRRQYGTLLRQGYLATLIEKHNNPDIYDSLNTFKHCSRKQEDLLELKALFLDIDCYKTGFSQDQVLARLYDLVNDNIMPMPTYIVDSGRGLYFIWQINAVSAKAKSLCHHCLMYLFMLFIDR